MNRYCRWIHGVLFWAAVAGFTIADLYWARQVLEENLRYLSISESLRGPFRM